MTRAKIAGGAAVLVLLALALTLASRRLPLEQDVDPAAATSPAITHSTAAPATEAHQGFLYGRVTANDGATYEGRLRWGGDEEAFWGDSFNGFKDENPWVANVPLERLKQRRPIEIFGVEIAHRERQIDLGRPFMARFGDITRIVPRGRDIHVTLKSGTEFVLDRLASDDLADGVRVWDGRHGVVDLGERRIRAIELLPTAGLGAAPDRLHGTVRTRQGDFTGFLQWDREKCVGTDELKGRTEDGELSLRFDTIRSIARDSRDSSRVTLLDGREFVLSGTREVGRGNRGIYVDDRRYGRVLVSWDAFERIDFSPGGSGPAYDDFPQGQPLMGSVTTRAGRRLAGRLVYDLDESETTETLDAPSRGINYTIPFGLVASIVPPEPEEDATGHASVTLHSGENLQLERAGDLGEGNAGMLIFVDGRERPEYVPWSDVERVDIDRPAAMFPPLGADGRPPGGAGPLPHRSGRRARPRRGPSHRPTRQTSAPPDCGTPRMVGWDAGASADRKFSLPLRVRVHPSVRGRQRPAWASLADADTHALEAAVCPCSCGECCTGSPKRLLRGDREKLRGGREHAVHTLHAGSDP